MVEKARKLSLAKIMAKIKAALVWLIKFIFGFPGFIIRKIPDVV